VSDRPIAVELKFKRNSKMHRFRSVSYSGIPVDGWDFVHSPPLRPQLVLKNNLPDLVLKEEKKEKRTLKKVAKRVIIARKFLKEIKDTAKRSNRLHLVFWVIVTIFCGCAATVPCELILKDDNMGTRITCLATYLFVITCSSKHNNISNRHIPFKNHLIMVCTTLGYNLLLTYAFSYHLPITLALILKNGSLVFQMCVGYVLFPSVLLFPSYTSKHTHTHTHTQSDTFFKVRDIIEYRSEQRSL